MGVPPNAIDVERLKALVKEYTGERIQLTVKYFPLPPSSDGRSGDGDHLALVYVPRRTHPEPLGFGRKGPHDDKNRPLFLEDDVYYRRADESLLAKGKAVLYLAGPRPCPYEQTSAPIDQLVVKRASLYHNLPDRNFICPSFVGRSQIIEQLWAWFGDEFSHVRVLAGEGGLGKTSIAYQFAEEVCKETEADLERVIWLTAKKNQFSGIENKVIEVPETHFTSYQDLLMVLCAELGYLRNELAGASEKLLKKYIQEGVKITPSLMIVDDVDSLEPEEQRKVLEVGFLFGGTKSRLLLTTRNNLSYSTDIAILIGGFVIEEYEHFVASLQKRYPYVALANGQLRSMHDATGGSPLFTESLYRLMRWSNPGNAIQQWRGQMGEEVRAAALRREVEQISPEAKRVLLAAAYLRECSYSELSQVTGYSDAVMKDCISELRSLHLLSAPQITAEARFVVGVNTQQYIVRTQETLAADYSRVEKRVTDLRSQTRSLRIKRDNPIVGAAINQAIAQLKQDRPEDALGTIVAAENKCKGHPDLLTMQARCLLKQDRPKADEARRAAKMAYEAGSRKDILFEVWYEAEWAAEHYNGAVEAAECFMRDSNEEKPDWLVRRAVAVWHIAMDQERAGNVDRAIADLWSCDSDLRKAEERASSEDRKEFMRQRFAIHDAIWKILRASRRRMSDGIDGATRAIGEMRTAIHTGDCRIITYLRLCEALDWLIEEFGSRNRSASERLVNLVEQRIREVREVIDDYSRRRHDERLGHVMEKWESGYCRYREFLNRRQVS